MEHNSAKAFMIEKKARLLEYAKGDKVIEDCLGALWDTSIIVCNNNENKVIYTLVTMVSTKPRSIKPFNLYININSLIKGVSDNLFEVILKGVFGKESESVDRAEILIKLCKLICTVFGNLSYELSIEEARILVYCHDNNAAVKPIPEDEILQNVLGAKHDHLTKLDRCHCIEINDGRIWLREKVKMDFVG